MVEDKKMKKEVLKELMKQMGSRVAKNDLEPKTRLVIKAEGDSPEEVKEDVIEKLEGMELPDEKELKAMKEDEVPEEDDEDFLEELPEGLRKALMKKSK